MTVGSICRIYFSLLVNGEIEINIKYQRKRQVQKNTLYLHSPTKMRNLIVGKVNYSKSSQALNFL